MTVSEFYTYTFVVFDEIAYEWVQGSYVAFEIKIFDEDQEVIVFTVEFSVRESQTCDPLLLGNEQIVFQSPFVFFLLSPCFSAIVSGSDVATEVFPGTMVTVSGMTVVESCTSA